MTLYQDCSSKDDSSVNMATRGHGLYFYIHVSIKKALKSSCHEKDKWKVQGVPQSQTAALPRHHKPLDRFNMAELLLWWSSSKIVQAIIIHEKMAPEGRGLFCIPCTKIGENWSRGFICFDALTELGAFMPTEFLCISVLRVASGPRVKLASCKRALNPLVVYPTDRLRRLSRC